MNHYGYWRGAIYLAIAGCGYGVMGPLVRAANSVVPPFTSMLLRYTIVAIVLITVIGTRYGFKRIVPLTKRDLGVLILVGFLGAGLANVAFSLSVLTTTIGNAAFLFSLYAVFTPLLGGILLHEWPTRTQWLALIGAVLGTALLLAPTSTRVMLGDVLAILGALLVSVQYVGTRIVRSYSAVVISLYLAIGSVVIALPMALLTEWWHFGPDLGASWAIARSSYPSWLGWAGLLAFAGANLTVNLLVSQGFRTVRSSLGGVLLLLEPVVGLVLGMLLFSEAITAISALGVALILVSGAVSVWVEGTRKVNEASVNPHSIYAVMHDP